MRGSASIIGCLVLSLLTSCGQPPSPPQESYFPLEPGMRWIYRVTTEVAGRTERREFVEHNGDIESLNDIPHSVRITDEGTRYYIRSVEEGIYRSAKRTLVESEPNRDPDLHWVLKRPYKPGTSWNNLTHPYVLRRISPYEQTLTRGSALKMAYQITRLDAVADVPAGRFEDCLLVEGEAQLTLYADGREGYQDILINTREWYAPGVGLVKLVREEPMSGSVFSGGRIEFELVALEP
ncbi:MAG: hypothetical protein ABW104_13510 [Candidatus Thiodiazotropha sp. 6PLUC2]